MLEVDYADGDGNRMIRPFRTFLFPRPWRHPLRSVIFEGVKAYKDREGNLLSSGHTIILPGSMSAPSGCVCPRCLKNLIEGMRRLVAG